MLIKFHTKLGGFVSILHDSIGIQKDWQTVELEEKKVYKAAREQFTWKRFGGFIKIEQSKKVMGS